MFSVIIPAKNEVKNIGRCIQSVYDSVENSDVEVIVVDNGSTDGTVEIAISEGAKVFIDGNANISGLRNLGASNASFAIIAFIDADCEATFGWLENAWEILNSEDRIGIVGDYYRLPENPCWIEGALFHSIPRKRRDVSYLSGGNMVMMKSLFLQVRGFDRTNVTGEDYVLCLKVKSASYRIVADPSVAVIHHGNAKTLFQWFKREVWCGMGMIDLYRYGKLSLPLIWAIFNICAVGSIVTTLVTGQYEVSLFLLCTLFVLPMGATLKRCLECNNFSYVLELYVIFLVYGFARTLSLVMLSIRKLNMMKNV